MALRRYARTRALGFGKFYATSQAISRIRTAVSNGALAFTEMELAEGERLDSIAGRVYGDARMWWVIAAASDIGWALQVPPGTLIRLPNEGMLSQLVG